MCKRKPLFGAQEPRPSSDSKVGTSSEHLRLTHAAQRCLRGTFLNACARHDQELFESKARELQCCVHANRIEVGQVVWIAGQQQAFLFVFLSLQLKGFHLTCPGINRFRSSRPQTLPGSVDRCTSLSTDGPNSSRSLCSQQVLQDHLQTGSQITSDFVSNKLSSCAISFEIHSFLSREAKKNTSSWKSRSATSWPSQALSCPTPPEVLRASGRAGHCAAACRCP